MNREDVKAAYFPGNGDLVIVMGEESEESIHDLCPECSMLFISGFDWNTYLSPWPAPAVFRHGGDFGGKADEMLEVITELSKEYPYDRLFIAGYSLAGLAALYFCTKTDLFAGCVSASGSMWYPSFTEYLAEHSVQCEKVYLSLGNRENKTKNTVMASVLENTAKVNGMLSRYEQCIFEMNEGGHFDHPEERLAKGIRTIIA